MSFVVSIQEIEMTPSLARQRYYPWVVIGIAFLTVAMAFGTRNAFAVFLIAVIEEFHWSRALASGALMSFRESANPARMNENSPICARLAETVSAVLSE